jgi:hypothetical protein
MSVRLSCAHERLIAFQLGALPAKSPLKKETLRSAISQASENRPIAFEAKSANIPRDSTTGRPRKVNFALAGRTSPAPHFSNPEHTVCNRDSRLFLSNTFSGGTKVSRASNSAISEA